MGRLGVIGGTGVHESAFGRGAEPVPGVGVTILDSGSALLVQRHGLERYVRAHEIDHRANVLALRSAGCDRVLGLSSTGSLRFDWPVGTFVCPDDFYAPHVTDTLYDDARFSTISSRPTVDDDLSAAAGRHTIPSFDESWRARVLEVWRARAATPIVDGGIYTQTRGPRFETPAEVRALARIGDLVGMTLAAECILAKEAGLAYAAVCVVDNLANGLQPEPLTIEEFRAGVDANRAALLADLDAVLPTLAAD